MKIRTWLFLSFFVVMVLPAVVIYAIYSILTAWNEQQSLNEYLELVSQYQDVRDYLTDPELYTFDYRAHEGIEEDVEGVADITLYREDGYIVHQTNPVRAGTQREAMPSIYEGLYDAEMTYSHFHMKEPVFVNDEIVGFFEVSIPRTERLAYVQSRSTLVFGASVVVVLFMSALIWFVLNRRINKPIQALRVDMDRFAKHVDSSESILYKKRDEIGELIQHFEQMKQETYEARKRVQQEQKEKETMTAALSHDLRTPLTSVLAYTESLQERELEPKTKEKYLATIRKKSLHMQQLIEDLHTFNLLKSDTVKERKVTIDGDEFFEMLTDGYDELCASKQITLNKQVNMSGSYDVHVNHMMRLVDNLVSNAIRHTPIGGEIHLLFQDAGQLPEWLFTQVDIDFQHFGVLIVQNEGETIDMVEANRIFEPFYQSDSSRTKEQGQHSGLGLSVASMITKQHGGEIKFIPVDGYGTMLVSTFEKKEESL